MQVLQVKKPTEDYKDPTKTKWNTVFEILVKPDEGGTEVPAKVLDSLAKRMSVNVLGDWCQVFRRKTKEEWEAAKGGGSSDWPVE